MSAVAMDPGFPLAHAGGHKVQPLDRVMNLSVRVPFQAHIPSLREIVS